MRPEVVMAALDLVLFRSHSFVFVATLVLAAGAASKVSSQHPDEQATVPSLAAHDDDPHVEMKRLMGRVERRLFEIDKMLGDAGAGEMSVTKESATGASGLVVRAKDASESVVHDIDRILELANHPHPPGGA
jgi:hypothetical protein